jgi:hypothetical protein
MMSVCLCLGNFVSVPGIGSYGKGKLSEPSYVAAAWPWWVFSDGRQPTAVDLDKNSVKQELPLLIFSLLQFGSLFHIYL